MKSFSLSTLIWLLALSLTPALHAADNAPPASCFDQDNLVAWCIVPFDASHRTPAQRAAMLQELGLRRCAYDWRAEHVPTFEEEILEYQKHGIEMFAFWAGHDQAYALFEKYNLHPQIWRTAESPAGDTEEAKVAAAAEKIVPLAQKTKQLGCPLGLYNHGGWGGEPRNLVAVCQKLRSQGFDHVGIVYNFHHGHGHIDDFAEFFTQMQPYLLCLNINGMNASGTPKILGIGKGEHELKMLQTVAASGYQGPIGILNHRVELDAKEGLLENLNGLNTLRPQLAHANSPATSSTPAPVPLSPEQKNQVDAIAQTAPEKGDVVRGSKIFSSAKSACLQCHKVGEKGGSVGPELTKIGSQREIRQLVESVLWPKREVKPEFISWSVATAKGEVLTGYKLNVVSNEFDLLNPATGITRHLTPDDIDDQAQIGTLMPEGLTAAMTETDRLDLARFLSELGRTPEADLAAAGMKLPVHAHDAATFPLLTPPLHPEDHLQATLPVNHERMFDFYAKEADYFRAQPQTPPLLMAYPGLDGGGLGHWGRQTEADWKDDRWNHSDLGSFQAGVFHNKEQTVPRALCVRLGDQKQLSACFNPDTLTYDAVWKDGFVKYSDVRHGFLGGFSLDGTPLPLPKQSPQPSGKYQGLYRSGNRIVFAYQIDGVDYLDAPWVNANGGFSREVAPVEKHSLGYVVKGGPTQWPQKLTTNIQYGQQQPYAIDTFEVPFDNPWKSLMYFGGFDFLPDGSALLCTMQGDVWHVTGLDAQPDSETKAVWKRFASGFHQAQGLVVADGIPYVLGRDMITRLHDRNADGEADFYECFSKAYVTSPAGHDFICGLERDPQGNFYIASGNQGVVKISPDGKTAHVIATGFRNPDGLGILPDGTLTVPCSEGNWTPATMVCSVPQNLPASSEVPHYGYGGPKNGKPPALPLFYMPRGLDNSAGGQVWINSNNWGPLQQHLLHFSFGTGTYFLVLEDEVNGQKQAAVVTLPGDFRSGAHRGRVRPQDGQLFVLGMNGWTCFTPDEGSLQRVRYTGEPLQIPTGYHVHENGVAVTFALPLDPSVATNPRSHFIQAWNYRYGPAYGSPEFSAAHPGIRGHDPVEIKSATILSDGRTLFLELPDLQPVNQLYLRLAVDNSDRKHDLFATVHALDRPYTQVPGYQPVAKTIAQHPLLTDLAMAANRIPNPWKNEIKNARSLNVETGKNLTYATTTLRAKAGEPVRLTLSNPDVVPHNWALVRPGTLQTVGELSNKLIGDPDAYARHYVPQSEDVLAYTDIVEPGDKFTIFFKAPEKPGKYPYLCTFPGHWMVMNGVLIVE
ncbi:DUF6797 domain-containing protein [Planctomicrobium piriforme]|uniref:Putative heme-binding domain-containing protein n=1 Tax=Planctomicrobium piriforme TaxID=1576369 RepID=A0A1I3LN21_9PLAN|nr:DUF6797 domain-containing protein [Planctomicrobium piriforme]SFI86093.1 putative heme-binding domain-containing protein [Planctomicrobium piriforme]